MLANLKVALEQKRITIRAYAAILGIAESSAQNKISEKTSFTYPEVRRTHDEVLPEYDVEWLFASDTEEQAV